MRPATTEMWGRRLLWFVGLWVASILVLGTIAMVLRTVLKGV